MDIRSWSAGEIESDAAILSRLLPALSALGEARTAGKSLALASWEFALEAEQLRRAGLTGTDLRWLICRGYVEHAQELTRRGAGRRFFRRLSHLGIPARCCVVLTAKGGQVFRRLTAGTAAAQHEMRRQTASSSEIPHWDARLRQLTWRGSLVKEFRLPAPNQEAILTAFEEEGWPARVDDPLPGTAGLDPKVRLHDAIKGLNHCQLHPLLRFRGDGTGKGVVWTRERF
jgi:hypothetical protein